MGFIQPEITKHPPEMRSSPEENIPAEEGAKRPKDWVWWVLGLLLIGGAIAVAVAGTGGGGGGSSSNSGGNSGSVGVGW